MLSCLFFQILPVPEGTTNFSPLSRPWAGCRERAAAAVGSPPCDLGSRSGRPLPRFPGGEDRSRAENSLPSHHRCTRQSWYPVIRPLCTERDTGRFASACHHARNRCMKPVPQCSLSAGHGRARPGTAREGRLLPSRSFSQMRGHDTHGGPRAGCGKRPHCASTEAMRLPPALLPRACVSSLNAISVPTAPFASLPIKEACVPESAFFPSSPHIKLVFKPQILTTYLSDTFL